MRWSASGGAVGAVLGIMLLFAGAAPAAPTAEYFTFPSGYLVSNFGVTTDGTGNVWFGASSPANGGPQPVASLARLVPSEASPGTSNGITFYPTPDPANTNCCATQLRSVSYSAKDDRLYYVRSDGAIGFGVPGSMVPGSTSGIQTRNLPVVTTPPSFVDLSDVAAAPGGGAWFTERYGSNVAPWYVGDRIAFYDGADVTEGPNIAIQNGQSGLSPTRYDARPDGIAVSAAGQPWFVESAAGSPGYRVATYTGGLSYQEYDIKPCALMGACSGVNAGSALRDVTVAHDGTVWFTNELKKTFGRFDPVTLQISQFTLSPIDPTLANGVPRAITTAPDGTIWLGVADGITNAQGNAILKIVPSAEPTAEVFKLRGDSPPLGIGADNAGNVWFSLGNPTAPSLVGRLAGVVSTAPPPAGGGPVAPPASTSPAAVPLKPATTGSTRLTPPQTDNGAINTNQICVGPPEARCSVVYLIHEHEYVTGFPGAGGATVSAKHKKKKPKPRVIGRKVVTLHGGQSAKVTVKLNALGKRILKAKKRLRVDFTATQTLAGGKTKLVSKKTLTLKSR